MKNVERTAAGFYSLPIYKNEEGNLIKVGEKAIAFQYGTIGDYSTQEGIVIEDLLEVSLLRIEEEGLSPIAGDLVLTALADFRSALADIRKLRSTALVEEAPVVEAPIDVPNEGSGIEPTKDDKSNGVKGFSLKGMFGLGGQTDNG